MHIRNLDSAVTELKKRLDRVETKLSAWEAVERIRKSDGSNYVSLKRNFKNATVHDSSYSLVPEKEISVCGWSKYSGWITDEIRNREHIRYEKNRKISEDRIIKEAWLEPYYYKTVDEIFEDIEKRIEFLRAEKEKYEEDIERIESVFRSFTEKIDSAVSELKKSCEGSSLYYICMDYLKAV